MKIHALSCDANGFTDGAVHKQIVQNLGSVPLAQADVVCAFVSFRENFKFNHELGRLNKPWVLFDFVEDGHWWENEENRFGMDRPYPLGTENHDWGTLNGVVKDRPPILTIKRELLKSRVSDRMIPGDYLAEQPIGPTQSKADWEKRRFHIFYSWGWSHPLRCRLHAQFFTKMASDNMEVYDGFDKIGASSHLGKQCVSVYTPWFKRAPMATVMGVQNNAKISISMPGCGKKCFRDSESPVNALPAFESYPLARSYPWDETNSVVMDPGAEYLSLTTALEDPNLYDRYRLSQENIRRYVPSAYVRDYVRPNIARCL